MANILADNTWTTLQNIHSAQRMEGRVLQQAILRLFEAVEEGDTSKLAKLLSQGISVDTPLIKTGEMATPGSERFFPEKFPWPSMNALGWAAWHGQTHAMQMLINEGADPWMPTSGGRDALWLAALGNQTGGWDFLFNKLPPEQNSGFWNARSVGGTRATRLMESVTARNVESVVGTLGRKGVLIDAVDALGRTALHLNLLQNPYTAEDQQIGKLLIDFGAPVSKEDHDGVSPAALAQSPEQEILINHSILRDVAEEARMKAQLQRDEIDSKNIKPMSPDDADFPQIQKPVIFKVPRF